MSTVNGDCSHGIPLNEYCGLCFRASSLAGDKSIPVPQSAVQTEEVDPTGRSPHEVGAKLDHGKNRLTLIMEGFANALWAVGEVGTYGAEKYTDNGWCEVPNGVSRYTDAMYRHLLKEIIEGETDPETNLSHAAQTAWNALARLELMLRGKEDE